MTSTTKSKIGLEVALNVPYEHAIAKVTEALKAEGFGVLTEIDVRATMKKKLNVDFQRYVILGACNPPLAYRALQADKDVGLLLPCNVIVYETDAHHSVVSLVDPLSMLGIISHPALQPIAHEARERLERVAAALKES